MVSLRCILKVKEELDRLGITYRKVILGEIILTEIVSQDKIKLLKKELKYSGLEIIEDKKSILIERIKISIIEFLDIKSEKSDSKFSSYLEKRLKLNYKYLANVFSQMTKVSISHSLLLYKIEKAKELISYQELNMSEIAYQLNFSSLAHFSCTFKNIEGIYPSKFNLNKNQQRICLEELIDRERITQNEKTHDPQEREKSTSSHSYPTAIRKNSYA